MADRPDLLFGYDFAAEGVTCVEFAQCGVSPLLKVVRQLGLEWHILTDWPLRYAPTSRRTMPRPCWGMEPPVTRPRESTATCTRTGPSITCALSPAKVTVPEATVVASTSAVRRNTDCEASSTALRALTVCCRCPTRQATIKANTRPPRAR